VLTQRVVMQAFRPQARAIAHVVLGSPYGEGSKDGLVPSASVLRIHLWAVGSLATDLAGVIVVLSTDPKRREIKAYTNIQAETRRMPCPVHLVRVSNNSLGSYGMYFHAFAVHRRRYDYYTFSEVDYVPVHVGFGGILARLYDATFVGGSHGMLVGVLQGHPVERGNMPLHPQGAHVMSSAALEHLFEHVFVREHWTQSMSDRMVSLLRRHNKAILRAASGRFDHIQIGVGLLMADAGIQLRDFTSSFRSPYWNHARLLDWTGVSSSRRLPINHSLFVPVQALFLRRIRRCCGLTWEMCRKGSKSCLVEDWRTGGECCSDGKIAEAGGLRWISQRSNHTISPRALAASAVSLLSGASLTHPPPWLNVEPADHDSHTYVRSHGRNKSVG
jgi:hypothetical protein